MNFPKANSKTVIDETKDNFFTDKPEVTDLAHQAAVEALAPSETEVKISARRWIESLSDCA